LIWFHTSLLTQVSTKLGHVPYPSFSGPILTCLLVMSEPSATADDVHDVLNGGVEVPEETATAEIGHVDGGEESDDFEDDLDGEEERQNAGDQYDEEEEEEEEEEEGGHQDGNNGLTALLLGDPNNAVEAEEEEEGDDDDDEYVEPAAPLTAPPLTKKRSIQEATEEDVIENGNETKKVKA